MSSSYPGGGTGRPPWVAIAIGLAVLIVVGVVAYMLFSNGDSSGGGAGGGYFVVPFGGELTRRVFRRFRDR